MKIRIDNLRKAFEQKTAVDIGSFDINNGEIIGLVGNNGVGKTTLFRLMLDLLKADNGCITLTTECCPGSEEAPLDINPAQSEEWKKYTGAYIDPSFLIDFLTPEEYFEFIGQISGMTKEEGTARLADFEQFMDGEILGQQKYIRNFSAGNKQKIGIIAALFNRPQLVILDEPFNFLDPSSQNVLKKIITDYNRETHATIIISSHNLQHTVEVSSRIALLERGRIINDLDNTNQCAEAELEEYFKV
jgi:ABC-2 type transport system ATP-binding protein